MFWLPKGGADRLERPNEGGLRRGRLGRDERSGAVAAAARGRADHQRRYQGPLLPAVHTVVDSRTSIVFCYVFFLRKQR